MRPFARIALVAAAALAAGSVPHAEAGPSPVEVVMKGYVHDFDAGMAIGGETDPYGWVLSPQRVNEELSLPRIAYLDAKDAGISLGDFAGRYCVIRGMLEADALTAGGVETVFRTFDLLRVIEIQGTAAPQKRVERLPGHILADLESRGADFDVDGTDTPAGGLSADGKLDGGRIALVLPLIVPPEDSADMFSVTAYVDRRKGRYWALRTGGFAGVTQWVGPFRLPRSRR